jgi:hypothetical protein
MNHPSDLVLSLRDVGQVAAYPTTYNLLVHRCQYQAVAVSNWERPRGQVPRTAFAARMMRSAVRRLVPHSVASPAAEGRIED